jgi:hypothetical protein
MWYLYTVEVYSATKKNEILSFASKWMDLESINLIEVSQAQKDKNHMSSLICRLQTQNKFSNIIGHGSHPKRRTYTGEIGKGKET